MKRTKILTPNNILKCNNNEVSLDRRYRVATSLLGVLSPDDHAVSESWLRPTRELGVREAAAITLGLILGCLVFGAANAITGEAQETQAGHRSAWQGPKLSKRVQWGAR